MSNILFLLFFLSLPINGESAPLILLESFCPSAKRIQPKSEYCQDNLVFTREAEKCLSRLRKEVAKEGKLVKSLFVKNLGDKQSQDYHNASFDNKRASDRLAYLLQLTEKVALRVNTYFDAVYFPIDSELPEVNQGDFVGYILKIPCYGDTVRALDSVVDDLVQIGRELNHAKTTAEGFAAALDSSEGKIEKIDTKVVDARTPASQEKGLIKNRSKISKRSKENRK